MAMIKKIKYKDGTESKKWYSDITINGHRRHLALSEYKPEAKRMLEQMVQVRTAQSRGDIVRRMSWPYFRETYLQESKATKRLKTFYHDRHAFYLVDKMTHLTDIEQMTPDRLARVRVALLLARTRVNGVEIKTYKTSAIVRAIRGMITAMRWAEDRKYVPMQNWRVVQKQNKEPKGRIDYYRRDDYLKLMEKLGGDAFTAAILGGRAGLRLGEVIHLQWEDIIFSGEHAFRISFRSKPHLTSRVNPKGWRIKQDDDLKKVRNIPILFNDLRYHLQMIRKPSGYVVGPSISREEDVAGKQIARAMVGTGVKTDAGHLGFAHILRHTFGSHLAQIGVSANKIKDWMGHESLAMTNAYMHLSPHADTINDINMVEKLCTGYVPVQYSFSSVPVLLSALNEELAKAESSSKKHESP